MARYTKFLDKKGVMWYQIDAHYKQVALQIR